MNYQLELFSEAKGESRRLPRAYSTLKEAIDVCVRLSNNPFWGTRKPVLWRGFGFTVKVAGGYLTVVYAS